MLKRQTKQRPRVDGTKVKMIYCTPLLERTALRDGVNVYYEGVKGHMKWIINSLLETDLYKFNMNDVVSRMFNSYTTEWTFKCRNSGIKFTPEMVSEIRRQVDHYCTLRFTKEEIKWLGDNLPWLSKGYLYHLVDWTPKREEILINEGDIIGYNDCGLAIEAHGTWLNTSMYEIVILAIVNEVYFAYTYGEGAKDIEFQKRTMAKFEGLKGGWRAGGTYKYDIGTFAEFGMRRRLSGDMQDWLIKYCVEQKVPGFVGTSNVYLAKKYGCKAIGTCAHEFIQCVGQATAGYDIAYSNRFAMDAWTRCFGIKNGTWLGDTITTDCFLLDFDERFATLFSGLRHDSGDPIAWGEKIIAHYKKLGIDPMTKTLLFSDSLDFEKATAIKRHFNGKCKISFGIGTYLANDTDVAPLNIVMKVTKCNGKPTAKLSDVDGKNMCRDDEYVSYLKRCIEWRLTHERN